MIGNPDMGAPVLGGPWIVDDALNAFDIDEGRPPAADDEVVIDVGSLHNGDLRVGDRTTVLTEAGPQPMTIVGSVTFAGIDSPGGASVSLFTPAFRMAQSRTTCSAAIPHVAPRVSMTSGAVRTISR
jgi:hypothetical protein